MIEKLKSQVYRWQGRIPWSRGYIASRTLNIKDSITDPKLSVESLPPLFGLGFDERVVEYPWVFSRMSHEPTILLDAGSVFNFEYILDQPLLKKKKITISTLAPEVHCYWQRGISYVYEDLRHSGFRDSHFDEIVSLSTLEHVGFDNTIYTKGSENDTETELGTYIDAVLELKRLLKPGGKLFLSMPFGQNVNHSWFQVFNSEMVDHLVKMFSPSESSECIFKYERNHGWKKSDRIQSKNALYYEKTTPQKGQIDKIAAAEAVVCLELVKAK